MASTTDPDAQVMTIGNGGVPSHERIDAPPPKTLIYAPVPEPRAKMDGHGKSLQQNKREPKPGDSPVMIEWRKRMASQAATEIYKQHAVTAECVNEPARNRRLLRTAVRGLAKVRGVMGLFVLAHKLMRTAMLAPHLMGCGAGALAMAVRAG